MMQVPHQNFLVCRLNAAVVNAAGLPQSLNALVNKTAFPNHCVILPKLIPLAFGALLNEALRTLNIVFSQTPN
jgi:hypothetical protein